MDLLDDPFWIQERARASKFLVKREFAEPRIKMTTKIDVFKDFVRGVMGKFPPNQWKDHLFVQGNAPDEVEVHGDDRIPVPPTTIRVGENKELKTYIYLTMFEQDKWKFIIFRVKSSSDKKNL